MTTIYLIRHAEAEGNLYRRVHGWYNSLITENGYRQIAALEERFRDVPVDAVYSSDLFRTMTTARAVYAPKGLELRTDPGLRELNLGEWEDRTFGEVRHSDPQKMDLFNRTDPRWKVENGETFFQLGDSGRAAPWPDHRPVQPRHGHPSVSGPGEEHPAGGVARHAPRGQHGGVLPHLRRGAVCHSV